MSEEIDVALRSDAHLGEGPVWDDVRQELVWVDILAGRIHRFSPSTGGDKTLEVGQPVGAAGLRVEGGLVLALRNGFGRLSDEGVLEIVSEVESDILQNRMNDGKCDPAGRFWAGTMNEMHDAFCGALYRLDPDLGVRRMISGVGVSNGLDWSPDGTTMRSTTIQRTVSLPADAD
jgi:sugar lactone lactonase YvrE